MHAAKIQHSQPLQAVLAFLQARGDQGVTTWEFIEYARVANPATEVSALRHNGYNVECKYQEKKNGRKVYRYKLLDPKVAQGKLFAEGA